MEKKSMQRNFWTWRYSARSQMKCVASSFLNNPEEPTALPLRAASRAVAPSAACREAWVLRHTPDLRQKKIENYLFTSDLSFSVPCVSSVFSLIPNLSRPNGDRVTKAVWCALGE